MFTQEELQYLFDAVIRRLDVLNTYPQSEFRDKAINMATELKRKISELSLTKDLDKI